MTFLLQGHGHRRGQTWEAQAQAVLFAGLVSTATIGSG